VAATLKNIGNVYLNICDYENAFENYNKCLEIEIKILGSESINVAGTLTNFGILNWYKGDYKKAL
jgi:hypothetical protein